MYFCYQKEHILLLFLLRNLYGWFLVCIICKQHLKQKVAYLVSAVQLMYTKSTPVNILILFGLLCTVH